MEVEAETADPVREDDEKKEYFASVDGDFMFSFEHVTVHVPGLSHNSCVSARNPITNYMQEYMGIALQEKDDFYALDDVSGYVRAGEMCLVLSSSDGAKATLLRALCGRLNSQDELHGTILLNGMPMSKSNQGWRRLSPYVSASDASHSPVLTVKETFTFAQECHTVDDTTEERVERLMDALGLSHVADTVVGDENLRGISGGQKRRVTIGEMMTDPGATFFCLENITDGLASTDSYALIEKLQGACKEHNLSGFISLLQPSDEMVQLFDKLLVLTSNGEQAYFGPVDRAVLRDIFGSDQEDSGSICDLVLKPSLDAAKEDAILQKFASSSVRDDMVRDLARIRAQAPPARERNLDELLPDKKYTTSRGHQFRILVNRRIKLISRNAVTYTRIFIAIVFGIIIGSLFSVLKNDIMGSLGRTGYMFLNSFLVLMLSAAVTIPSSFRERVTLFKHRSAEFYSGRMAYLAQLLTDMPLSLLEAVLLSCISYFWVQMNPGANHFFFFMGCLIALECVGQALGRVLCALCRKQVTANAISSVLILLFATVGGFMPSYGIITWVIRWLSWLTPVSYAFEAMMINEFAGRSLDGIAVAGSTVGDLTGEQWLQNFNLPRSSWGSLTSIKIFDLFMLFFFAVIYDLIGLYYMEHTREWYFHQIRRPQATVKKSFAMQTGSTKSDKKKDEEAEQLEKDEAAADVRLEEGIAGDESQEGDDSWPQTLSCSSLTYSVPLKRKINSKSLLEPCLVRLWGKKSTPPEETENQLTLLNSVDALFRRGRMCALMGTSGAGKSTFMDVVAGYKTGGTITGDISIDGRPKDMATWKKISGYAEQSDILNPYLSVLETLRFTAACRLPRDVDHKARVQEVIDLMDLDEYKHFIIGREHEGEGLAKHVRKRVTIAVQLVIRPKVLFLDEPTTGLGTNAAALVIGAVRRSTDAMGIITLATIHQPSKLIWDTFDDALLLTKGGRVTYMGEMGANSETVLSYFKGVSEKEPPARCNPADYVLACLDDIEPIEAEERFKQSPKKEALTTAIQSVSDTQALDEPKKGWVNMSRINTPFQEFILLTKRNLITQWRNPGYSFMRLTSSVGMSIYMGLLFFGDKTVLSGAVSSIGAIFFLVFILVIPMQAAVVPLVEDRAVLYRETVSGTYSRFSYGLGQLAADIPFHILNMCLMFVCFYFLVDFKRDGESVGYFLLLLFMSNWVIQSLGQLYAYVLPNEESANGVAGLTIMLSVILMGFLITVDAMPSGWTWAYWANLFHYMLQGFVTNELAGKTYTLNLNIGLDDNATNAVPNTTQLVAFDSGVDPMSSEARQSANLLDLATRTEDGGVNPESSIGDFSNFVRCMVENECLTEPIPSNFVSCSVFKLVGTPPCKDEFETITSNIDVDQVLQCFGSGFGSDTSDSDNAAIGVPSNFSMDAFEQTEEDSQMDTAVCLLGTLLPPGLVTAVDQVVTVVAENFDLIMFVLDILENGLRLPGELILYFFGWAEWANGELVAPFKWWYCLGVVAIFLGAIELFKIVSVQKIVWTKR